MLKTGLSIAHFRSYVPLIEKEAIDYFKQWGDSGERGRYATIRVFSCQFTSDNFCTDLFKALSELIILTASRCLHGWLLLYSLAHVNI